MDANQPLIAKIAKPDDGSTKYGMLYMLMGSTSMALMSTVAKIISKTSDVSPLQIGVWRSLIMAVGCFAHAKLSMINLLKVPRDKFGWLLARLVFGYLAQTFQFAGIYCLPFSLAITLVFTQPIAAALINYFYNGERLSNLEVISIICAMFGVVVLTIPTVVFPFIETDSGLNYEGYPNFYIGVVFCLGASITSGFAYLTMRKMGTDVHSVLNPMWFGVFSVSASYFNAAVLGDELLTSYSHREIGLLILMGTLGWIAQEGVSKAIQNEKAGRAASINYLQVVIAWVFDVAFFGHEAKWTEVLGTLLIVFFTFLNAVSKGFCNNQ